MHIWRSCGPLEYIPHLTCNTCLLLSKKTPQGLSLPPACWRSRVGDPSIHPLFHFLGTIATSCRSASHFLSSPLPNDWVASAVRGASSRSIACTCSRPCAREDLVGQPGRPLWIHRGSMPWLDISDNLIVRWHHNYMRLQWTRHITVSVPAAVHQVARKFRWACRRSCIAEELCKLQGQCYSLLFHQCLKTQCLFCYLGRIARLSGPLLSCLRLM